MTIGVFQFQRSEAPSRLAVQPLQRQAIPSGKLGSVAGASCDSA